MLDDLAALLPSHRLYARIDGTVHVSGCDIDEVAAKLVSHGYYGTDPDDPDDLDADPCDSCGYGSCVVAGRRVNGS